MIYPETFRGGVQFVLDTLKATHDFAATRGGYIDEARDVLRIVIDEIEAVVEEAYKKDPDQWMDKEYGPKLTP